MPWRPLLIALVVPLAAAACSSDDATTTAEAPPTTSADATTTSTTIALPEEFAVGRIDLELVDPSRPTAASPNRNLPELADRTLAVMVLYPAEGEADAVGTPVEEAPTFDRAFPLVVFSHGVGGNGPAYLGRLQQWAREGYVVAAPTFPLSSGPQGEIQDFVNQPADVHFIVGELLDRSEDPADPLHGSIDGGHVALAGHSLGAMTTIGAAFNSCCTEEWTDAAIEISGIQVDFPGGSYEPWPEVPLLAIHGASDGTLPVSGSENLVAKSQSPTYFLRYDTAGHTDLLAEQNGELMDDVVLAFLDRYLKGDPAAMEGVPEAVEASGVATFEERAA